MKELFNTEADTSGDVINERPEADPRLYSLASTVISMPLRVPYLPDRGGAVWASEVYTGIGGGYNVMRAAARQGARVICAAPLGTGPNSMAVRQALAREGIESVTYEMVGDIGMTIVLIENTGHNTSILSPGVEAELTLESLQLLRPQARDWVYLSASDLVFPSYRDAIGQWLPSLTPGVRVAMAASPMVTDVGYSPIRELLGHINLFTANEREAQRIRAIANRDESLWQIIGEQMPTGSVVLHRLADQGCLLCSSEHPEGESVPTMKRATVDTVGVGDTHTGVVLASLLAGMNIRLAVRRANIAGALTVASEGLTGVPSASEIDANL
ncbi:MAG: PfkB family carbohydrate kinase [Varibaculum sp.]|nr:PfkB family carbohydrate kinase [Varibaculum sp.]